MYLHEHDGISRMAFCHNFYSLAEQEPVTVDTRATRSGVKWHKKYQSLCSTGSGEGLIK